MKGFINITVGIIISILLAGFGGYFITKKINAPMPSQTQTPPKKELMPSAQENILSSTSTPDSTLVSTTTTTTTSSPMTNTTPTSSPKSSPTPAIKKSLSPAPVSTKPATITPIITTSTTATPSAATSTTPTPPITSTSAETNAGIPQFVNFSFTTNVSKQDESLIRQGVSMADKYLRKWYGRNLYAPISIKVSADTDSQGCCNVAEDSNGLTISFHTAHLDWMKASLASYAIIDLRPQTTAHEMVHMYQGQNGCGKQNAPVALRWLQEGMAEWLSFKMLSEESLVTEKQVKDYFILGMKFSQPIGPLREYEVEHKGATYYTFALAVDRLVQGNALQKLDSFCTNLGDGLTGMEAFQSAFGISLQNFYNDFETYRTTL